MQNIENNKETSVDFFEPKIIDRLLHILQFLSIKDATNFTLCSKEIYELLMEYIEYVDFDKCHANNVISFYNISLRYENVRRYISKLIIYALIYKNELAKINILDEIFDKKHIYRDRQITIFDDKIYKLLLPSLEGRKSLPILNVSRNMKKYYKIYNTKPNNIIKYCLIIKMTTNLEKLNNLINNFFSSDKKKAFLNTNIEY
jgi:hypothetical protein